MKRLFAIAMLLVGSTLMSSQLMALGLGELELDSALNQPLKAEIGLVDSEGLSEWEIKPVLASADAFDRYGVERSYFLTKIKFSVVGNKIQLSTREAVTEPFLNFLVELNWPSGRVVREYTVLLDPPTFEQETFQPLVAAPSVSRSNGQLQRRDNNIVTRSSSSVAPRQPAGTGAEGTYTVQPNDTMWAIALATRPDASVSPQQMMLAIQRANPQAFIGGNINRLKTFEVLNIPGMDDVQAISRQAAVNEMARQNGELTGLAQMDATGRNSGFDQAPGSASRGEIRLVTAAKAGSDSAGASGDTQGNGGSGRQEALENDLAIALENLDQSRRENAELADRLAALEEQIGALQRLISLKDDQLATMQSGAVAEQSAVVDPAPVASAKAETAVEPAPAAKTETVAAAEPKVVEPEQPRKRFVPPPPPPPPSFFESLLMDPIMAGGALAAILLLLGLAYVAIKRRLAGKEGSAESETAKEQALMAEAVAELNESKADDGDDFEFHGQDEPEQTDTIGGDFDFMDDGDSVSISTESLDANDQLLTDVDEHIVYGRFDDARDLLKSAIADAPERTDLSLKLLEVFVEQDDAVAFNEEEVRLRGFADDFALDSVESMRARLTNPVSNEFDEVSLEDLDMEFQNDLDDADTEVVASEDYSGSLDDGVDFATALDSADNEVALDDSGMDFGDALDLNYSGDTESDVAISSDEIDLSSDSDDNSLDFDLSSFDEPEVEASAESEEQALDDDNLLEFELSDELMALDDINPEKPEQAETEQDDNSLDFDLGGLELPESDVEESAEADLASLDESLADEELLDLDLSELDLPESEAEVGTAADADSETDALEFDSAMGELEALAADEAVDESEAADFALGDLEADLELDALEELAEEEKVAETSEKVAGNELADFGELESLSDLDSLEGEGEAEESAALDDLEGFGELEELGGLNELEDLSETDSVVDTETGGLQSLDDLGELEPLDEFDLEAVEADLDAQVSDSETAEVDDLDADLSELDSDLAELDSLSLDTESEVSEDEVVSAHEDEDAVISKAFAEDNGDLDYVLNELDTDLETMDAETAEFNVEGELDSDDLSEPESEAPVAETAAAADLEDLLAGDTDFSLDSLDFELDELGGNEEAPKLSQDDLDRAMEWDAGEETEIQGLGDVLDQPFETELETLAAEELPELQEPLESDVETPFESEVSELDDIPELALDDTDVTELDELEELPELSENDLAEPEMDVEPVAEESVEDVSFTAQDAIDLDELAETEDEFAYLAGTDASETKLDLARAYVDMGEADSARELLGEILQEGSDKQKQDAQTLLDSLS